MDVLLGQPRVVDALRTAMRTDRLGHGLLFLGPSGVGRETCARAVASGLLCESRDAVPAPLPFGCGICRACRRARSGAHPDVHILMSDQEAVRRGLREPDGKKKPSSDILVDRVRELVLTLRKKSFEGGARVAIVVDAHRMNANAQNALLKTLEEPAERTWLILIAPQERALLPTIASRCLRLPFAPLAHDVVEQLLIARGVADAHTRAQRADGSMARALELDPVADAETTERREGLLATLLHGSTLERLDAAEQLGKERVDVDVALDDLERGLGVALRLRAHEIDDAEPTRTATTPRLLQCIEAISNARMGVARNGAVQLVLEELFLGMQPR